MSAQANAQTKSLWSDAWKRFKRDRLALAALSVIAAYSLIAVLAKLNLVGASWGVEIGTKYQAPSFDSIGMLLGTDFMGRSVFYKLVQGTQLAMTIGFVTSLISIFLGVGLGAIAGYFGGWIDEFIVWLYTVISSVPGIMLLIAIAFVLGRSNYSVYVALGVTSWIGLARVIRGEFLKHKEREYVIAATALGASHFSRIFKHILPNTFHFVIINFALQFMGAIKSEVILSFLGLGTQGAPSWGRMIDDAKQTLVQGVWWEIAGATGAMFLIILAFNIVSDALRDAFDPKMK